MVKLYVKNIECMLYIKDCLMPHQINTKYPTYRNIHYKKIMTKPSITVFTLTKKCKRLFYLLQYSIRQVSIST